MWFLVLLAIGIVFGLRFFIALRTASRPAWEEVAKSEPSSVEAAPAATSNRARHSTAGDASLPAQKSAKQSRPQLDEQPCITDAV